MTQVTLRRVDPFSVAKVIAVVQACMGLLIGACVSAVSMLAGFAASALAESGAPGWFASFMGVGAVIGLPILYGLFGFVAGLIGGALYNFFAGVVGGIRVEFDGELVRP